MQTLPSAPSAVTAEQMKSFLEKGYCVIDGLYSQQELDEIERFFDDWKDSPDGIFDNGDSKLRLEEVDSSKFQVRAMHPHRRHKKVADWFTHPRVASVLEALLGKSALGVQTMYYFKPPGASGQGMHQDNFYLLAKPTTCIAAWTPIDGADEENGCLLVTPGSHNRKILCTGDDGESWTVKPDGVIGHFPKGQKPVAVPVKRGQTMFFGGNLIHGSGPNKSKTRWRRTFIGHYVDEATESISRFYHPVLDMQGEVVSHVAEHAGGGPCGDSTWQGSVH
ncbi:MAG: phytanoyl-CoA dioxygenase family protein [Verrucomicrobiota bacterium]